MKIHIINNDAECGEQLRLYFLLLLKADKIQKRLEKKVNKILLRQSIQKMDGGTVKSYHRLGSLSRFLNTVRQNISFYLMSSGNKKRRLVNVLWWGVNNLKLPLIALKII